LVLVLPTANYRPCFVFAYFLLKAGLQAISANYLPLTTLLYLSMNFPKIVAPALLLAVLLGACKKEQSLDANPNPTPTPAPTDNGSAADKLKDSTLVYTKDIYLWYNKIPATFNARTYTDPSAIMTAIRQYSIEPGFSAPVDRWSFAVKQTDWDNVSSGVAGDFGISVFFRQEGDLRVRSVEPASPAGKSGVKRGWRITAINGSSNLTTANSNYIVQNVYESGNSSFTFQKPDGSTVNLSLNAAYYQEDPVVLDSVYTVGGKKIGYFVFNSFLGDTSSMYNEFNRIFNGFASEGVQDLVVDLRYNGGGYVTVAERLANYLAPSSANGNIMMTQKFNDKYTSFNSTEMFRKRGSLNLNRIFFIVSNGTASASELLINSLKPYMDVMLLGASKTHGKPVGYFPIPVEDWYILPVSFYTVNKNGEGNYYGGMALSSQVADGLDKDWGDRAETSLQSAINYISTGAFRLSAPGQASAPQQSPAVTSGNQVLDQPNFKGAIDTRGMR
ncbi:MAG TPA: S41 family peptidase, partial [Flavisolibacter sp.]|nr:S41 family peptidase [Flavisolibacter sp.]